MDPNKEPFIVKISVILKHNSTRNWIFPSALFLIVVLLSLFRISGTSAGLYHNILYGTSQRDPSLLYGNPQPIRSDEWLVNTPFTVSQSRFGFPKLNPAVGSGFDTSVILDLPNKDWSEIFKPQNWSFFVLPLEQAFAFKWWLIGYLLIISSYFLILTLLPKRRLLAALLSLSLFFAPFIQWWYQTMALAPIYYSCLVIIVFLALLKSKRGTCKLVLVLALAYILSAFILILYPPFQIPCALAVAAFFVGYLLQTRPSWRSTIKQLLPACVSVVLAGFVIVAFFLSHKSTIQAITGTIYPGHRMVQSGGYSLYHFFDGIFDRQLQNMTRAANYIENQSEASNFIYLWPYLLVPSLFLAWQTWRRKHTFDYPIILTNALLLILMVRLFLPLPTIINKILLLSSIPHNRLLLGVGFLNLIQLVLFLQQLNASSLSKRWMIAITSITFIAQLGVGFAIRSQYPLFISRTILIAGLAFSVALMVYLILKKQASLAAGLLLVISFWSTHHVHPLYIGLGELTHSKVIDAARKEPQALNQGWAFIGSIATINLLPAGGLRSYSATFPYPQMSYYKTIDPSQKYQSIYNRYGFAIFTINNPKVHGFTLNGDDSYFVDYKPCSQEFKQYIKHVVSQSSLKESCLKLDTTVSYPSQFYYIYKVSS